MRLFGSISLCLSATRRLDSRVTVVAKRPLPAELAWSASGIPRTLQEVAVRRRLDRRNAARSGSRHAVCNQPHCGHSGHGGKCYRETRDWNWMKLLVIACLAVLGSTPTVSAAQDVDAKAALRSWPSEGSPSLVLTPQGAERLARPERREGQLSLRSELETPGWSRAQSLALLWATTIACSAMGSGCSAMLPAPTSTTPPGGEPWQLAGCKTPETCGWMWKPVIPGPYVAPQQ
jgi:hypothetical protein